MLMRKYNLKEAAEFLHIKPQSLMQLVYCGQITANKLIGTCIFKEDSLVHYRENHSHKEGAGRHKLTQEEWTRNFYTRYGKGAYQKLLELFEEPCNSYEEIGNKFGVTREAARKWHDGIFPEEAGTGHERLRTCQEYSHRRKLLGSKFFSEFYRIIRQHFQRENIEPIQCSSFPEKGFRKDAINLNGKKVLLIKAHRIRDPAYSRATYRFYNPPENSDYIFYLLDKSGFVFLPRRVLPQETELFTDSATSTHYRFKNNFNALPASSQ